MVATVCLTYKRNTKYKHKLYRIYFYKMSLYPLSLPINAHTKKKLNSVALVRKRTISTERSPLVGEVTANLYG
jgi:hypothetical protein